MILELSSIQGRRASSNILYWQPGSGVLACNGDAVGKPSHFVLVFKPVTVKVARGMSAHGACFQARSACIDCQDPVAIGSWGWLLGNCASLTGVGQTDPRFWSIYAGMPDLQQAVEAIKDAAGMHVLKFQKEAITGPEASVKRPYHQLNNVSAGSLS